jgi:hypothetical protein
MIAFHLRRKRIIYNYRYPGIELKINIPSKRRGRRTNDTIVSAVTLNILYFLRFVKFQQFQENVHGKNNNLH